MLNVARHRILGVLAAIILLAGCQYESIVNQLSDEQNHNESQAISFGNGVIDNPVKTRALSLLSQHTNTMGVWGWQTASGRPEVCLFNNNLVSYDPELEDWTYSPARYWEKGSSYRFYAYAPNVATVTGASVSIDESTGHININNVVLEGSNTMNQGPQPRPFGTFSSVTDVDWLVDREGKKVYPEQIGNLVTFNMQHIMAKFVVMININKTMSEGGIQVVIDSLSIGQFYSKGDFTQKLDHSPVVGVEADDSVTEWLIDTSNPTYALHSARGALIDSTGSCVIESLLLPQLVDSTQNIIVEYSMHYPGGRIEHFDTRIGLKEAFGAFRCANSYTLNLMIGPDIITFNADATVWDNQENEASVEPGRSHKL